MLSLRALTAKLTFRESAANSLTYAFKGDEFVGRDSAKISSIWGVVKNLDGRTFLELELRLMSGDFYKTDHECGSPPFIAPFNEEMIARPPHTASYDELPLSISMKIMDSRRQEGSGYGKPSVYVVTALFTFKPYF